MLKTIQRKIEDNWIDAVRVELSKKESDKNVLNPKIYKVYESWINFLSNKREEKRIHKFFQDENLIKSLKSIDNIIIGFSMVITYHKFRPYSTIAVLIGNNCIYKIYKNLSLKSNTSSETYSDFLNKNNIEKDTFFQLGVWILEMFITREVFNHINSSDRSEPSIITINENTLKEVINNLVIHPSSLPMICPPVEWSEDKFGGFLLNSEYKINLIGGTGTAHDHLVKNKESLYSAVNYLNNIKFKINTKLLEYLKNKGSFLLDSPVPTNKHEIDQYNSMDLQRKITLKIAETYSEFDFFLNIHADWRGRLYTNSFWISYQANDLSNALTNLSVGEVLTEKGRDYLYIYGANLYIYGANLYNEFNTAKKPYKARIEWVEDNMEKILRMDSHFINDAEEKFAFASFCLVMRDLNKNPNCLVHLPVFLDATCSGIQHLAGLIQDYELGSRVNLIPQNDEDSVGDIYGGLVLPINKAINEFGEENIDYTELKDLKLDRSILKLSIMTKVYNVTNYGIAYQLENKFDKIVETKSFLGKNGKEKTFQDISYKVPNKYGEFTIVKMKHIFKIATIINDQIFVAFPSLKNIYDYFINITKIIVKIGVPMVWFTPTGLEIHQNYLESERYEVSVSLGGRTKTLSLMKKIPGKTDKGKQSSAIIPNIVHSLDAAHLIGVIIKAINNNFTPILSVHDCFGTHPNKMDELNMRVRKEFIQLYTNQQFLKDFHQTFINTIKLNNKNIYLIGPEDQDRWIDELKFGKGRIRIPLGETCQVIEIESVNKNKNITKIKRYAIPEIPKTAGLNLDDVLKSKYIIT